MNDVIVIGAGPAGLMAAISAASNGASVLVLERNSKAGKKLIITGGGRCNLTNLKPIKEFISNIPVNNKMLYSTLNNFGPEDIYNFFTERNVELKIEDNDRVFPLKNNSNEILSALLRECEKLNIQIKYNSKVINLKKQDVFEVSSVNTIYKAKKVIIAPGGVSYTSTGSDGSLLNPLKKIGISVTDLYPAETYVVTKEKHTLAGISLRDINIYYDKKVFTGDVLFTHKGLTGPGIYKVSEHVYHGNGKTIYLGLSSISEMEFLKKYDDFDKKKELITFIRSFLIDSIASYFVKRLNLAAHKKIGEVSKKDILRILNNLNKFPFEVLKTGTLDECLVTGGGIDLKDIDTKTMESKLISDLYFAGENLDFHGPTGGYNLTIAFSTGYTAGLSASRDI